MRLSVTPDGIDAILHSLENNALSIVFKKVVLGNGTDASKNDWAGGVQMSNPLVTINAFTEYQREDNNDYITLKTILNNANVEDTFKNTETGVYIEPLEKGGSDILFAYGYTEEIDATVIPASTKYAFETTDTIRIYVGASENVSAILSQYSTYATKVEFDEHLEDTSNPHKVSKNQIGLGNVDNTSDSNAMPEFTEASDFSNVNSGEPASTLWGKVKKFISTLLSHINNTQNPHITTYTQVGAAAASHNHSASNITSGVLSTARGGTGNKVGTEKEVWTNGTYSCSAGKYKSLVNITLDEGLWLLQCDASPETASIKGKVEFIIGNQNFNNTSGDISYYDSDDKYMVENMYGFRTNFIYRVDSSEKIYLSVCSPNTERWFGHIRAVRFI